jgi:hypothetical protein
LTRTPLRITDNEGDSVRSFGGATATMQSYLFDDRNITWQTVEAIGAQIYVLAV